MPCPPHSGTFNGSAGNAGGDGITVEHGLVSMAWSQFEHAVDVDVKILPTDGTALGTPEKTDNWLKQYGFYADLNRF